MRYGIGCKLCLRRVDDVILCLSRFRLVWEVFVVRFFFVCFVYYYLIYAFNAK